VLFAAVQQDLLIEAVLGTGAPLDATIHAIATEPTHIHVLVSWAHSRTFRSMRASIRGAMTRVLNERFGKRTWFSDSPSRKRVLDHEHFDHLILEYLPSHRGVTWTCARDVAAAERRDAQRTVSVHERTRHPDQND
jgi:REP element-mobilizing transposase RayT